LTSQNQAMCLLLWVGDVAPHGEPGSSPVHRVSPHCWQSIVYCDVMRATCREGVLRPVRPARQRLRGQIRPLVPMQQQCWFSARSHRARVVAGAVASVASALPVASWLCCLSAPWLAVRWTEGKGVFLSQSNGALVFDGRMLRVHDRCPLARKPTNTHVACQARHWSRDAASA
jgi:hypothetical protein